jgi:hypothetical protein
MKPILRTILSNPPTSSESLDNYCKRISGDQWNATKSKIKRFLKGMEYPMGMSGVQKIVAEFSPPGSKEERIETKDSIKVEYECDEPIPDMDLYKALGVPPGTPLEVKRRSWDVHMKVKVPIEAETGNVITRNYGKPFGRTITVPTIIKRTNHYVSAQVDKADIRFCVALQEWPAVNAKIDGEEIVYSDFCDISIAVSAPKGLVVPVVRNAESLSFDQIEKEILRLATKARDGKLSIEEMQGGTFTITNGGVFGSMMSTPIINVPQSAILGMHNIVKRPIVENEEVVVRPMMYVALSYDHRIIDGRESVSFLVRVKELLEDPARLLLGL